MNEAKQKPAVISVEDEQKAVAINKDSVRLLAVHVLDAEGASSRGELAITFVSVSEMSSLNARYRGEEGPTDVLSFSLLEGGEDGFVTTMPQMGNIVICPEVAAANATEEDRELQSEIYLLVAHGILHILDYRHASFADEAKMFRRQTELVDGFLKRGAAAR